MKIHKALCNYRFIKIEKLAEKDFFSIDYVLSYMVRLIIVEKWLELDKEEGKKILDHLIRVAT